MRARAPWGRGKRSLTARLQGVTNNVAWNYGPRTATQYRMAVDRYFWNRKEVYKSIVPMETLSWRMADDDDLSEPELLLLLRWAGHAPSVRRG